MSIVSGKKDNKKSKLDQVAKIESVQQTDTITDVEQSKHLNHRATKLEDIVGRASIKKKLKVLIHSAKSREDTLEHLLFYGPPGLGKTTFGNALASEFGSNFIITSGPALTSKAELASIISNLKEGDILFIDEIHRLNKVIEEFLYPVLEDFKMDITFGKGALSNTVRIDIPRFTLIGATTQIGLISAPLRDRFGMVFKVDFFSLEELAQIVIKYSTLLEINIDTSAALEIAKRSRGTARIAIRNLRRARDYSYNLSKEMIDFETVLSTFTEIEIDEYGLDLVMRKYLDTILTSFKGGPVGVTNIAASIYEDIRTIEEVYEPYLIKLGFLKRTSQGRVITEKGIEYISNIDLK
jgi:Holliday junction DNA helicase RuvB